MSTIQYTLKFNRMGEWARQQSLKLRDTYVAYGVRGQIWVHYKCIDEKESDIIGIWCCKSCRILPETNMQLCEKIDEFNRTVNILLKFAN